MAGKYKQVATVATRSNDPEGLMQELITTGADVDDGTKGTKICSFIKRFKASSYITIAFVILAITGVVVVVATGAYPSAHQQMADVNLRTINHGIIEEDEACGWDEQLAQCYGLSVNTAASTAEECQKDCCANELCSVWQYNVAWGPKACWMGVSNNCRGKQLSSGGRKQAATTEAPTTQASTTEAPTTTIIKGQPCVNVVVVDSDGCTPGDPDYDPEGHLCSNDGQVDEAYCSYTVGAKACAYCNSSGKATTAKTNPTTKTTATQLACPLLCTSPNCKEGASFNEGMALVSEQCTAYCSKEFSGQRYCGKGPDYKEGDFIDCSQCKADHRGGKGGNGGGGDGGRRRRRRKVVQAPATEAPTTEDLLSASSDAEMLLE